MDHKKVTDPKQPIKQQSLSTGDLLKLLDKNEVIFQQLKSHLMGQLNAYEAAFSRQSNKYTENRDFDHFQKECRIFTSKGKDFIDRLSEIKNNCSKVIKNLPEEQKMIPTQASNSFDMFVNEQIDRTLEYKIKAIEYEHDAHRPFQNQLEEFQID